MHGEVAGGYVYVRDLVCFAFALALGSDRETWAHTVNQEYLLPFKANTCVMSVCCTFRSDVLPAAALSLLYWTAVVSDLLILLGCTL